MSLFVVEKNDGAHAKWPQEDFSDDIGHDSDRSCSSSDSDSTDDNVVPAIALRYIQLVYHCKMSAMEFLDIRVEKKCTKYGACSCLAPKQLPIFVWICRQRVIWLAAPKWRVTQIGWVLSRATCVALCWLTTKWCCVAGLRLAHGRIPQNLSLWCWVACVLLHVAQVFDGSKPNGCLSGIQMCFVKPVSKVVNYENYLGKGHNDTNTSFLYHTESCSCKVDNLV